MTSRLPALVVLACAVTVGTDVATAQQPSAPADVSPPPAAASTFRGPRYGWDHGMMMGPGMMGWGGPGRMAGLCNPRSAGLAEWRMEKIERIVRPSESQRAALNALRAASAKAAEQIAGACPREFPTSATARMELMQTRLEIMLTAVKTVRSAFDAFYATLSAEQKTRLDEAGPRHWAWHHWNGRGPSTTPAQ
jgi:hypothetical protein